MVTFNMCGREYITKCPNVAMSYGDGATCSEHVVPGPLEALRERLDLVVKREVELHYGIRRDTKVLDHKPIEHEAHLTALAMVGHLHAIEEAARRLVACNVGTPRAIEAWTLLVDALAGL